MIKTSLSLLALLSLVCSVKAEQKKPNILLICVDDLRPELPSFGKDYIYAPAMEKLFTQGRLFKRHYVQAPTCGASRFAMLTGLYPREKKHRGNGFVINHDHNTRPSFPALFRANGYHTVSIGKVSHYPGNLTGKDWADKTKPEFPNAWDVCPNTSAEWKTPQGLMHGYANGQPRIKGEAQLLESEKDARYPDDAVMDSFRTQLTTATKQDKPWLLAVGLIRPHLPFACEQRFLDLYKEVKLPAIPANQKPAKGLFWHGSGEFMNYLHTADPRKDSAYSDLVRKHYAACVSSSDRHIANILKYLNESGQQDSTVIVLWGDHGWHLGEQKIWGKHSPYAVALHSPFFIKVPNQKGAGIASNQVVESVDLYPTLCDLTGITKPKHLAGKSLVNILNDSKAKSDNEALSYWGALESVITKSDHKIVRRNSRKVVQHYDLTKDPHETTNLIK